MINYVLVWAKLNATLLMRQKANVCYKSSVRPKQCFQPKLIFIIYSNIMKRTSLFACLNAKISVSTGSI